MWRAAPDARRLPAKGAPRLNQGRAGKPTRLTRYGGRSVTRPCLKSFRAVESGIRCSARSTRIATSLLGQMRCMSSLGASRPHGLDAPTASADRRRVLSLVQDDFLMGREREDGHVYFVGGVVAIPGSPLPSRDHHAPAADPRSADSQASTTLAPRWASRCARYTSMCRSSTRRFSSRSSARSSASSPKSRSSARVGRSLTT